MKTIVDARKKLFAQSALQMMIMAWVAPPPPPHETLRAAKQRQIAAELLQWRNVRDAHQSPCVGWSLFWRSKIRAPLIQK